MSLLFPPAAAVPRTTNPLLPHQPPVCVEGANVLRRRRRRDVSEVDGNGDLDEVEADVDENLTIEVFTGLYVNEDEEVTPCKHFYTRLIVLDKSSCIG